MKEAEIYLKLTTYPASMMVALSVDLQNTSTQIPFHSKIAKQ